jgi:hypothetical protein
MKTQKTVAASKMINRFDSELKSILINDLKTVKNTKADLLNIIQHKLNSRLNIA